MSARQDSDRPSLWKTPLAILLVGVLVTAAFVAQANESDRRVTREQFDRTRVDLSAELSREVTRRIVDFDVLLDFVNSQTQLDDGELAAFLGERTLGTNALVEGDPGYVVAEIVADLQALEMREQAAGRSDFEVFSPIPSNVSEHVVITHIEGDIPLMGRTLLGFDVTSLRRLMSPPPEAGENRIYAQVANVDELFGGLVSLGASGGVESGVVTEEQLDPTVIYLIARYVSNDGRRTGFLTKLESVGEIIADVASDIPDEYRLVARLPDSGRVTIADVDNRTTDTEDFAGRLDVVVETGTEVIDLAPLELTLTATDRIAVAENSVGAAALWLIGLGVTVAAAGLVALRARRSRALIDTNVELRIAQTMAATDPLTGLLNRQGLVDLVESDQPMTGTLLFIDLDNFKAVNDGSGHAEGDRVLRSIAAELRQAVRSDDFVCRIGGDEFLIFLRGPTDAKRIADLRGLLITGIEAIDGRISCSIGVASRATSNEHSLDELFNLADTAMYDHKRNKKLVAR